MGWKLYVCFFDYKMVDLVRKVSDKIVKLIWFLVVMGF